MKRNFNVIQIKGFMGIVYLAFIVVCLAAGFGWFPGWVCMKLWNLASSHIINLPSIGIFQGMLLWAIIAASYFTFRKDKLVVFMNASDGLSEEELKSVFADMKKNLKNDMILQDMINARRTELKIKNLSDINIPSVDARDIKDKSSSKSNDKVQSK